MAFSAVLNFLDKNLIPYEENAPMGDFTGFKTGKSARILIIPESREQLLAVIRYLHRENEEYLLLGNGSNIFFAHDYDGLGQ